MSMHEVAKAMREAFEAKIKEVEKLLVTMNGVVSPQILSPLEDLLVFYHDQFQPDLINMEKEYEEMLHRLKGLLK